MGVTFRVYQNESNTSDNRSWPLDFIPRLIKKDEWKLVEKGLIQRVKALNFFIEDCYNERKFLKEFDIGDNLVIETSAYKKYCQNPEYYYAFKQATLEKKGLFREGKHIMEPWKYRKKYRP